MKALKYDDTFDIEVNNAGRLATTDTLRQNIAAAAKDVALDFETDIISVSLMTDIGVALQDEFIDIPEVDEVLKLSLEEGDDTIICDLVVIADGDREDYIIPVNT